MLLEGKSAVVYGAAGSMGSAVAQAFAREGARVFLAGRTSTTLDTVAAAIRSAGGRAETAVVDAMDQSAVDAHLDRIVESCGSIDVSFNAISYPVVHGPLAQMSLDDFLAPIIGASRTNFLTATGAARRMARQGGGVIVLLSSTAALEWRHRSGGFNVACAGIETLTRCLAAEFGRDGVRAIALRPNFTPETYPGVTEKDIAQHLGEVQIGRLPFLREVADSAVYAASDAAGAMTGAVLNLSCGAVFD
jgi:3-oxoacyl-[acyl-carrier protein] reductase